MADWINLGMKKSSIGGKQYLDDLGESRGTLVLHLGGVGKYMSQIQDGLFIQGIWGSTPPRHGKFVCWPTPFPPMLWHVLPTLGNVAPWPTPTLPMPQLVPPTLGNVVLWPVPTPPMPQHVLLTLGNVVPQPTPLLPMP